MNRHVPSMAAFEHELAAALNSYADAAPVDVGADAIAALADAGAGPRGSSILRLRPTSALRFALVAALVLALTAGALLFVAGLLQRERVPWVYRDQVIAAPTMLAPRLSPALVPLSDGRVLVAGGDETGTATAEVLDPTTGTRTTAGELVGAHGLEIHAGAPLPEGRALLLGETGSPGGSRTPVVQIFDSESGGFEQVGPMLAPHINGAMAVLVDGRVLVSGGTDASGTAMSAAEVFDPARDTFRATGFLLAPRARHISVGLADGRVLVLGGESGASTAHQPVLGIEVYDPGTGAFSRAGFSLTSTVTAALLLPDDRVVVFLDQEFDNAMLWDPLTGTVASPPGPPVTPHDAAALDDGRVLLIQTHGDGLRTRAVLYGPDDGSSTQVDGVVGWLPSATRLQDGRILLAGGRVDGHLHGGASGSVAPPVNTVQILE